MAERSDRESTRKEKGPFDGCGSGWFGGYQQHHYIRYAHPSTLILSGGGSVRGVLAGSWSIVRSCVFTGPADE